MPHASRQVVLMHATIQKACLLLGPHTATSCWATSSACVVLDQSISLAPCCELHGNVVPFVFLPYIGVHDCKHDATMPVSGRRCRSMNRSPPAVACSVPPSTGAALAGWPCQGFACLSNPKTPGLYHHALPPAPPLPLSKACHALGLRTGVMRRGFAVAAATADNYSNNKTNVMKRVTINPQLQVSFQQPCEVPCDAVAHT